MAYSIVDTPQPVQRYLPRLGSIDTIIRYITSRSPHSSKHIHPAEARAIKVAGKKLGIVHEVWGDFRHAGHGGISAADGRYDGRYGVTALVNLGAPPGAGCYFAVDTDATAAQVKNNVLPYFEAVYNAFKASGYRVGIYGPGALCQAVKDAGFADLFWLANAKGWKGYSAFKPHADLVQLLPTHIAGGLDVDPNVAQSEDWGQFVPFTAETETAEGEDVPLTEARLGQGDPPTSMDDTDGEDFVSQIKSLVKSKIAWLAGGLGGGSASMATTVDPETQSLFMQLGHKPVFWLALACIVMAGAIVYYRWRDHGRGKQ